MSQAGFGDSSSQESISPLMPETQTEIQTEIHNGDSNILGEPTAIFNSLPRQILEQELLFCNERSQQAQVLLRQAQEQLQLSQLVIQRQETLTQTLQSRIEQLESELQQVHTNGDELRDRLKRQQHHTSQLKAALERCLENSVPANAEIANNMALSALASWSSAKLADEKIAPMDAVNDSHLEKVVKIASVAHEPEVFEVFQVSDPVRSSEPLAAVPLKNQPISPLIIRQNRAAQEPPLPLNLPTLQSLLEPKITNISHRPKLDAVSQADLPSELGKTDLTNADIDQEVPETSDRQHISESLISANSAANNSSIASTVAIPNFMQALYSNPNMVNQEEEVPAQMAIASVSYKNSRKAVASLASVQLPQFPPLPRHR
jgi:uncharacterized protein involved in tolerance to divalent cations